MRAGFLLPESAEGAHCVITLPPPQTSFPQHVEDLQLPSQSCKCANNANPAG